MQDFHCQCKGKKPTKVKNTVGPTQTGFTLIEILIVVVILLLIIISSLFYFQRHLMRSRDATRKSDLDRIKVAFEEYYNDKRCYPLPHLLLNCGDSSLSPYLKEVPCDPLTREPYLYQSYEGDYCQGYRLLAKLEVETDQDIIATGCDSVEGCGGEDGESYNWGMAIGGSMTTSLWHTGGTGGSGEEVGTFYCTPIYGGGYECQDLTYQERWSYFEMRGDDSCTSYETKSDCDVHCTANGGMEPGIACVCLPGSGFKGCR